MEAVGLGLLILLLHFLTHLSKVSYHSQKQFLLFCCSEQFSDICYTNIITTYTMPCTHITFITFVFSPLTPHKIGSCCL